MSNPRTRVEWFRVELEAPDNGPRARARQYGLAIALQRLRQFDEARSLARAAAGARPGQTGVSPANGQPGHGVGPTGAAPWPICATSIGAFRATTPSPCNMPRRCSGNAMHERAATASEVLRQQLLIRKEDPQLHELYARASSIAGQEIAGQRSAGGILLSQWRSRRSHPAAGDAQSPG